MLRAMLLATLLAGCYQPSIASCQLACAADRSCPDGLTCSATSNRCVTSGVADTCGTVDSGIVDGPGSDAPIGNPCDFVVSNVSDVMSVCALLGASTTVAFDVSSTSAIATGNPGAPFFPPNGQIFGTTITEMGVELAVMIVSKLTVENGIQLQVVGKRPLVVISLGDIDLKGEILMVPTSAAGTTCGSGAAGAAAGAAGGGGGYGLAGAAGGAADSMGAVAAGGAANGSGSLVPLQNGCLGGSGAIPPGGLGGQAGMAIELAAHGGMRIEGGGSVRANGGSGLGTAGNSHGAGGGGSGGAIFLEAALVMLDPGAAICANGGPGGSTGTTGVPAPPGTTCSTSPEDPTTMNVALAGGVGGAANGAAGAGQAGDLLTVSGSGGGGSAGRIRIHGPLSDGGNTIVSPTAIEN